MSHEIIVLVSFILMHSKMPVTASQLLIFAGFLLTESEWNILVTTEW
jgi:hypothetical protein